MTSKPSQWSSPQFISPMALLMTAICIFLTKPCSLLSKRFIAYYCFFLGIRMLLLLCLHHLLLRCYLLNLFLLCVYFRPSLFYCRYLRGKDNLALASPASKILVTNRWTKYVLHSWALYSDNCDCLLCYCLGIFKPQHGAPVFLQPSVDCLNHINSLAMVPTWLSNTHWHRPSVFWRTRHWEVDWASL